MTNNRKKLAGILTIGLLLMIGIAGTFAYLTDKTSPKVNTFTVGKVGISLTEPKWEAATNHKITPGAVLDKDPTITVAADSETAYVFAELAFTDSLIKYDASVTINYSPDWKLLKTDGNKKIYAYQVTVPTKGTITALAPVFTQLTFANTLTAANLEELKTAQIIVTGYAIQATGFPDAAAAWAEVSK